MPIDFDFARFQEVLYKAARKAFQEVRRKRPRERFYVFGFYANVLFAWLYPICNSEEGLHRLARRYASKGIEPDEESALIRWNPEDWAYKSSAKKWLAQVNRMLKGMADALTGLPEKQFDTAINKLSDGALAVLKRLDRDGVFGERGERDRYVVNLVFDQRNDNEFLTTAKKINPPKVFQRLRAEIKRELKMPKKTEMDSAARTGAAPGRPGKKGPNEFFVMSVDYDKRGNAPWHGVEARPLLSDWVLNTPEPLAATWTPLNARIVKEKIAGDIFHFGSRYAVNEKALRVLRPFLGDEVEALQLDLPQAAKDVAPLFVLHPLGGDVDFGGQDDSGDADSYLFRRKDVSGRHYFKSGIYTFVSDDVRRAIEDAGLRGVSFYKPK